MDRSDAVRRFFPLVLPAVLAFALAATGCGDDDGGSDPDADVPDGSTPAEPLEIDRLFTTDEGETCLYASPIEVVSQGERGVLTADLGGTLRAHDPITGELQWSASLPEGPEGAGAREILATPAALGNLLVVGWQHFRTHHFIGVFDLETRAMATDFPVLQLGGSVPNFDGTEDVDFRSDKQLMRGIVKLLPRPGAELGLAYVALGNAPNSSPHHGWIFELDLDAWRAEGAEAAVLNRFSTTADNDCGPEGDPDPGLCGGGIWNAAGLQFYEDDEGQTQIYFATGNGRTNYNRRDYANSLLRITPGLEFEDGCDPELCADYDEVEPSRACLASCRNVFTPRLMEGEPPLQLENGLCDGLAFTECYRLLDADLGSSGPVRITLPSGDAHFVQAGKDGALYLVDGENMGVMHQRLQVMEFCGTEDDPCTANWLGMFVTHPVVAEVDGDPVVILASNMADRTHWSGISAVRISETAEGPRMSVLWRVPEFDSEEGSSTFRHHPGRPVLYTVGGVDYVFVVETRRGGVADPPGRLWGVRVDTGELVVRERLADSGQRWSLPLVLEDRIYVAGCDPRAAEEGYLMGFQLSGGGL